MFERNYLVIYDIHDDKVRRKVVKILETYGIRVQYSSFECHLTFSTKRKLKSELSGIIDHNDSVRVYRMPEKTEMINNPDQINSMKKHTFVF